MDQLQAEAGTSRSNKVLVEVVDRFMSERFMVDGMASRRPKQPRQAASQHKPLGEDVLDAGYVQLAREINGEEANTERRTARAGRDAWLTENALRDELAIADADYAAGNTISGEALRRRYGLT